MRRIAIALLLSGAVLGFAHDADRIVNQASDLVPICKSLAEARYIARNITPYQWSAAYHDRSNILFVDGKLRVHGDDVEVHCFMARGAPADSASMQIDDP